MQVNTLLYLGFVAAAAILNYALPRALRPYFLLIASYVFYGWSAENRALLPVLIAATLGTWGCGYVIGKAKRKPIRVLALLTSLLLGLGMLFFYKYFNMFGSAVAGLTGGEAKTLDLITPLGLSYFTFAALSYSIDVYRKRCKVETNLFRYALFVSFFPVMFTGPIERYPHFRPQLERSRRFSYNRCAGGAFRMLWGYVKKMVLADNLALYVALVYGNVSASGGPNLLAATMVFAVQLYMDFSGSCDIALGAARILGYDLLENFNSPFEATNFGEFWRRWHISMTGWFREYVYFPLGGSRCGLPRKLLNTMIVFLVSGLWHGGDWRYLMWGASCGLVSVCSILTAKPRAVLAAHNPLYRVELLKTVWQRLVVFLLFAATLVFFACAIYDQKPFEVYAGLVQGWHGLQPSFGEVKELFLSTGVKDSKLWAIAALTVFVFAVESHGRNVAKWIRKRFFFLRWPLYYLLGAAILFFAAFGQSIFIYQQY